MNDYFCPDMIRLQPPDPPNPLSIP